MDINRFGRQYRSPVVHPGAHGRELPHLLRHPVSRTGSAQSGRPLRRSPAYAWHRGARRARSARRPAGNGSTGTSRNARRRPSSRGPAGLGRARTGRRRSAAEHRATRERAAPVRRVVVRQDRGQRPGRRPSSCSGCATTTSPAGSATSPTPRRSTRAAASRPTSPSPAWPTTRSSSSPARPAARTTWPGCAGRPGAAAADVRIADVTGAYLLLRAVGAARARDPRSR